MPLCPVGGRARGLPVPRSPLEAVYLVGMYMGKGGVSVTQESRSCVGPRVVGFHRAGFTRVAVRPLRASGYPGDKNEPAVSVLRDLSREPAVF